MKDIEIIRACRISPEAAAFMSGWDGGKDLNKAKLYTMKSYLKRTKGILCGAQRKGFSEYFILHSDDVKEMFEIINNALNMVES